MPVGPWRIDNDLTSFNLLDSEYLYECGLYRSLSDSISNL